MRFEERELPPYAEPVQRSDLREGVTYFIVTFADGAMLVPQLRPVVFAGTDLNGEGEGRLYFQDFDSFQRGTRCSTAILDDRGMFDTCLSEDLGFVFDYEHAVDVLLACSLRRRGL